jgi:translation machinery-associated protein 16
MPIAKSFSKITKLVNKKKGKTHALHEHSRDSRRLQKASGRDVKLAKKVEERERANKVHRMYTPSYLWQGRIGNNY